MKFKSYNPPIYTKNKAYTIGSFKNFSKDLKKICMNCGYPNGQHSCNDDCRTFTEAQSVLHPEYTFYPEYKKFFIKIL